MSKADNTNYQTLADFARHVGVDRSTVLAWVRSGKIKSRKRDNSKKHHRLNEELFYNVSARNYQKPYPKYSTTWSETEIYILRSWTGTDEQLAKAVGRSVNAVRIKRCRLNDGGKTRFGGFYTTFDRPEVAKLRGSSGGDPREKSEAVKERYDTGIFKEPWRRGRHH